MSADSAEPLVTRSNVTPGKAYDTYREHLRSDFAWSCAYCSRGETEVQATSFEIDHYQPRAAGGTDVYSNLYWVCARCNSYKRDFVPKEPPSSERLVRLDHEHPNTHIQATIDSQEVRGITDVGCLHINLLYLNAEHHRRVRRVRRQHYRAAQLVVHGLRVLTRVRTDQLPRETRTEFIRLLAELKREHATIQQAMADMLRSADADRPTSAQNAARRARLRELGVLGSGKAAKTPKHQDKRKSKKRSR